MNQPSSEYARFEHLGRCLFAVEKDTAAKQRTSHEAEKRTSPNNPKHSEAEFHKSLRRFAMKATDQQPLQCSFCGKTAEQVQFLLAGGGNPPSVYICGGCVDISASIIEKTKASGNAPAAP